MGRSGCGAARTCASRAAMPRASARFPLNLAPAATSPLPLSCFRPPGSRGGCHQCVCCYVNMH
eukprot:3106924-Amphidinium_carterae.1